MKGLNEESIAQIDDVEKLKYLLNGVTQKNAKQLKRLRVLQRQLKTSRSENHNLSVSLSRERIEKESARMFKWERDFEKLRADYNNFAFIEVFEVIQNQSFENSEFFKSQITRYKKEFERIESSSMQELKALLEAKNEEIAQLKLQIEELKNELEDRETAPMSKEIEKIIADKDQSIVKLRGMLQNFVKSDQMKQLQIDELQMQMEKLTTEMSSVEKKDTLMEELNQQKENSNSESEREFEAKCDKLSQLLEKSNAMYAALNDKYQALLTETESKDLKLQFSDYSYFELVRQKTKTVRRKPAEAVLMASLKRTLLQYFLADLSDQSMMIPVVLDLVDCSKEQIKAAQAKFRSNQQFVNRLRFKFS